MAWQGFAWNLLSQKYQKNRGIKRHKYIKKDLYLLVQMAIFVKDKIVDILDRLQARKVAVTYAKIRVQTGREPCRFLSALRAYTG